MGKPTGFMEFRRVSEGYEPVEQRVKDYREFVAHLTDAEARQQGARCMDCGIPFCNNGCPVNNIIPDWNDLVYRGNWKQALDVLHSTNNFPEVTGRICPAPCEAACTLNINNDAVGIKSIEHAIIDKGGENGWVVPQPAKKKTGKKVAVVGSGPAGLAAAQQLARAGHSVTVFEKNSRIGGLLRYGIPDFKLDKRLIDWRMAQLAAEGVKFQTSTFVGKDAPGKGIVNDAKKTISPKELQKEFDAVILAGGAEQPRDLPVPGRELKGVHYALEFLIPQNKEVAGDAKNPINVAGKHVVVIGGGDTGSDCVGTSNRHGAASITQIEVMPRAPEHENKPLTWPYWPLKLRTSSSHEEGCERDWAISTKEFVGEDGVLKAIKAVRVEFKDGKMVEMPGSEFELKADFVFLAMGFTNPLAQVLDAFGVEKDARGNAKATTDGAGCYQTSVKKVFVAGDMRRGQSLVVWAIREGRQAARAVDEYLMGSSVLPR
ncbi:glutamate synthase [NADPH] small chain [Sideroxyarcus emersonii]|uniref:Glutamate synthase [NADPH] small chain n=1 Tax=Sideroxyarcus emersonii TaxID=2764705 RepID=A0AAN1X7M6_9PROT|nr:glutamate synthase subunit beta [Sideroxyarcus emersonii]BCK86340.1 glutamate synthase [NADPH] small chain [Sideroxyarcus emersonii]